MYRIENHTAAKFAVFGGIVRKLAGVFGLLALLLTATYPAFAALTREPYLQLLTPTSVTIVWQTDLNSANGSQVHYSTVLGNLNKTATGTAVASSSNSGVTNHFVTINGLSPNTKYYYDVGTSSNVVAGGTSEHYFLSAPNVGSVTPFTAWILGDSGNGSNDQLLVRNAMLSVTGASPPEIVLHAGDIVYEDGTDTEFTNNHFAVYSDILRHTVLWPTLGNHEARSVNSAMGTGPYFEAHVLPMGGEAGGVASSTESYYSFDYANVHFIVLDSMDSSLEPSSSMLQWLQSDLDQTLQEWVIAYWHHPPYTKGSHNSDNAADSGGRLVDMRENVLPILEAGGVDLVLGGHSHIYERSYLIDGVYGYGSSPNFVTPDFNVLDANGNILNGGDGDLFGDGAYSKSPGGVANDGTVYVVAGHGGKSVGGSGGHPVMVYHEVAFGSVLLNIQDSSITLSNVNTAGVITDTFTLDKGTGGNQAPNGIIDTPSGSKLISVGETVSFTGTGTDPDNNLPLTHQWNFGAGSGITDSTTEDPGLVTFDTAGVYTVTYTVTDAQGLVDPTPGTVEITVTETSGFIAYNDLAWGTGQLNSNITVITSPSGGSGLPSQGELIDFGTGGGVGVTLTVSGGEFFGDVHAAQGAEPLAGTDADSIFNGKVSGQGAISYKNQSGSSLVLTFTGLDPVKLYDLAYFAHRNNYAWDRASLVTISGQDAFTNNSSAATDNPNEAGGVLFTGPSDSSTRLPSDNDNGYVAQFDSIDPGSDGQIVITISFDGNAGSQYKGKYASALMLREAGGSSPGNQAPDGVIDTPSGAQSITVGGTVSFTGTGTDPDNDLPLTHRWSFGAGSGLADITTEDPGSVTFDTAGVYSVTYTVTDAQGLVDPTPATVEITVTDNQTSSFTAFNDLAWGTGQLNSNITVITSPSGGSGLPSQGELIDFGTGVGTGVTLSVSGGEYFGDVHAVQGAEPLAGTDAGSIFNGKVSGQGAISYKNQSGSSLVLTFTGLDPVKLYDLAFFAHRNNYAWDRASLVTISGQDTFSNNSSAATDNPNEAGGVLFTGPSDSSTRLPADNDNGYVAQFDSIDPGSDGQIVITISFDGNVDSQYKGKYASAVMLREAVSGGTSGNQAPNGVIDTPGGTQSISVGDTVSFTGTGTDLDNDLPLSHRWSFGTGSGIADITTEDPGFVTFGTAGVYSVTYTVTDAQGLADPTPATVEITVIDNQTSSFTAYNDLAWGTGQLNSSITVITSPSGASGLPSQGELIDFGTGEGTGVTLTVSGGEFFGDVHAGQGAEPAVGTDADSIFNGKVSGQGAISYKNQSGSSLVLTFTGLDPVKLYDLAFFAHRNNYAWDRASLVTISGQDAFINNSSAATDNPNETGGVLFTGPSDPSTRLPSDNDFGYVAQFDDIDPGSDGQIVVTISFDGNATSQYKGKYASALMLQCNCQ